MSYEGTLYNILMWQESNFHVFLLSHTKFAQILAHPKQMSEQAAGSTVYLLNTLYDLLYNSKYL